MDPSKASLMTSSSQVPPPMGRSLLGHQLGQSLSTWLLGRMKIQTLTVSVECYANDDVLIVVIALGYVRECF